MNHTTRGTLDLKQGIGLQSRNRRPDVAKVETFLDLLGEHDTAPTEGPTGYYSIRLEDNLKAYQARNGLRPDGVVNPHGETLGRIKHDLKRKLGPAALTPRANPPRPNRELSGTAPRSLQSEILKGPLDYVDLPKGPSTGAHLIPAQATGGPLDPGRRPRPTRRQAERSSERRFNEELDRVERQMKQLEENGRRNGLTLAPRALRHFREGSGKTMHIKPEWLRARKHIRAGERRVQGHFKNWMIGNLIPSAKAPNERIIEDLLKLKDGGRLDRGSTWKAIVAVPFIDQFFERDLHNATGTSHIESKGSFRLVRKGNTIRVVGRVDYQWKDTYDWKKGETAFLPDGSIFRHDDAIRLQHHRGAQPFKMRSHWSQTVTGTISVTVNEQTGELLIIGVKLKWMEPGEGRTPQ